MLWLILCIATIDLMLFPALMVIARYIPAISTLKRLGFESYLAFQFSLIALVFSSAPLLLTGVTLQALLHAVFTVAGMTALLLLAVSEPGRLCKGFYNGNNFLDINK